MSVQFQPPEIQNIPSGAAPAEGIRLALAMLMEEAIDHGYRFCALHIRVAIAELDEVIGDAAAIRVVGNGNKQ